MSKKMELHKGDKYKDVDGTEFQVFGALDDTYTYFFIANLRQNIVIRMQPKKRCCISIWHGEGELMDGYSIILILGTLCWIASSSGESRNSTVNTVIFGLSVVALLFLRLFKVI